MLGAAAGQGLDLLVPGATGPAAAHALVGMAAVYASAVAGTITQDTVRTGKLLRRGIDIDEPADATLRRRPISDFAVPSAAPVTAGTAPATSRPRRRPPAGRACPWSTATVATGAPAVAVAAADGSVAAWVRERDVLAALGAHAEPGPGAWPGATGSGVTRREGRPSAGT